MDTQDINIQVLIDHKEHLPSKFKLRFKEETIYKFEVE